MPAIKSIGLTSAVLALCFSLSACDSGGGVAAAGGDSGAGAGAAQSGVAAGDFVSKQGSAIALSASAQVELMRFVMPAVDGTLLESQALVALPQGDAPTGGWPVLLWGHGTTGVGDQCAPSALADMGSYRFYVDSLLSEGYAVVAPDYEGMGTSESDHPYLNLDSAARAMNYAMSAAVKAYPSLSTRYATIGHSQGGHAAIGAAELAAEVAPLLHLGAVAVAPASHIAESAANMLAIVENSNAGAQLREDAAVGWLGYASYVLYGLEATDSSFDYSAQFTDANSTWAAETESLCSEAYFDKLRDEVPLLLQTDGNVDAILPSSVLQQAKAIAYMQAIEPAQRAIDTPVLILQGSSDVTVFPQFSQQLRDTLRDNGTTVTYTEYNATHHNILASSYQDAIIWLNSLFASP